MNTPTRQDQSAFFVLNVWEEKLQGGRVEWRGEALHVDSGAVCAFEDWPDLVDLIADALSALSTRAGQPPHGTGKTEA